ncbi:Tll0287-like domain-containing protein [Gilvimarinus sp. F26214L]|uniref:Tll0287-like domain-containing protein n=1 Tax=Gilvimarinus sp. DZF01 TaxID=3461371 RepID=UPI0040461805
MMPLFSFHSSGTSASLLATCAALTLALPGCVQTQEPTDTQALGAEAREIVQQFAGQLKPRLQQAMQEGGPTNAVSVCAVEAPAIARELSTGTGWSVKRVSLRPRNRTTAQPDEWERNQLERFDERQAAGETPAQINTAEMVNGTFRYMQAQGVEPLCLTCHGQNLSPAVSEALQEHYPGDRATGYTLGQVRGAFSLAKKLE